MQPTLFFWEYEKGDFSLRLDTEAGPFGADPARSGVRGADMGDRSGALIWASPSKRVANFSGANVSGANVSGAKPERREC